VGSGTKALSHQGSGRYVAFSGVWISSRRFHRCFFLDLGVPLDCI
jgi:hypothetical protein